MCASLRVLVATLVLASTASPAWAQSLPAPGVAEQNPVERNAETPSDDFDGPDVVSEPQQFDADTPVRPTKPPQPLLGIRERIALSLMRSFIPEDKQDEYDQIVQIADEVATHVDRLRGVPQRRSSRRTNDTHEQTLAPKAAARPNLERDQHVETHEPGRGLLSEDVRRANEDVVRSLERLKDAQRRLLESRRRMEEMQRQREEQQERVLREMERRKAERERQNDGKPNRGPAHVNPFRPPHARPGSPRYPHEHEHKPDHHRPAEQTGPARTPDHPRRTGHHDQPSLNIPQFKIDALVRERQGLELEVERMQAHIERSRLRAATAERPDAVAVWAVERVIELYGDDAPEILADMRPQVSDSLVKRYITMRLAELADRDRQRAIGPLRDLITGRLSDDRRRDRD